MLFLLNNIIDENIYIIFNISIGLMSVCFLSIKLLIDEIIIVISDSLFMINYLGCINEPVIELDILQHYIGEDKKIIEIYHTGGNQIVDFIYEPPILDKKKIFDFIFYSRMVEDFIEIFDKLYGIISNIVINFFYRDSSPALYENWDGGVIKFNHLIDVWHNFLCRIVNPFIIEYEDDIIELILMFDKFFLDSIFSIEDFYNWISNVSCIDFYVRLKRLFINYYKWLEMKIIDLNLILNLNLKLIYFYQEVFSIIALLMEFGNILYLNIKMFRVEILVWFMDNHFKLHLFISLILLFYFMKGLWTPYGFIENENWFFFDKYFLSKENIELKTILGLYHILFIWGWWEYKPGFWISNHISKETHINDFEYYSKNMHSDFLNELKYYMKKYCYLKLKFYGK